MRKTFITELYQYIAIYDSILCFDEEKSDNAVDLISQKSNCFFLSTQKFKKEGVKLPLPKLNYTNIFTTLNEINHFEI